MKDNPIKWLYSAELRVQRVRWYRNTQQAGLSLWELVDRPETYIPKHDTLVWYTEEEAAKFGERIKEELKNLNKSDLSD